MLKRVDFVKPQIGRVSAPASCMRVIRLWRLGLLTEEIGQIYQQDGADLQAALDSFERAGDWYSGEDATA